MSILRRLWKHIDMIAAVVVIGLFFSGRLQYPMQWFLRGTISPDRWNWAADSATPILGIWMGMYCIASIATLTMKAFSNEHLEAYERRYKARLDQAHGNPIMEAEIKAVWKAFSKDVRDWQMKTFWAEQTRANWDRATVIAYQKSIFVITIIALVSCLPMTVYSDQPVAYTLALLLALYISHYITTIIVEAADIIDPAPPIIPPVDIPPMLQEDTPPMPLLVSVSHVWAKWRALPSAKKKAQLMGMAIFVIFGAVMSFGALSWVAYVISLPTVEQRILGGWPVMAFIAGMIFLLFISDRQTKRRKLRAQENH
ncbi:MAG: hypothetical protein KF716_14965 [Anaerolineae bacterium]|nr:hypothetical protein [Anaerolineae bacterium]